MNKSCATGDKMAATGDKSASTGDKSALTGDESAANGDILPGSRSKIVTIVKELGKSRNEQGKLVCVLPMTRNSAINTV